MHLTLNSTYTIQLLIRYFSHRLLKMRLIINCLDSNKSNDISPKLLKALCNSFCPILTYLFNSCMLTGTFPDKLKIARVIPLFRSGNRNLMSNYRPISILPTLSKNFEKLISFWTRIKFYTTISLVSEKRTQQSTRFKQL